MTLAELLVATALMTSVIGGVFSAIVPARAAFATQQETVDLQQRLRIAIDTIVRNLRMASLVRPYRTGVDDLPGGVLFRADAVTIGFPPSLGGDTSRAFFLRADADGTHLMEVAGAASSLPLLDDVVALRFEYFGDPEPPRIAAAVVPDAALAVTYGPAPPRLTDDDPADVWGRGENCTFAVAGGAQVPRLPVLGGSDLAALAATMLTDGPWCPDASHPERFDADLLRVRRVRVLLRLQATTPFRGPAGALFSRAGTAADARRYVPDRTIRTDAALRNWHASP